MALTVTQVGNPTVFGDKRVAFLDVDFDNSYPAGGELLQAADVVTFEQGFDLVVASPNSGLVFEYDHVNEKLQAFVQGIDTDAVGALTLDDFPITAGVGTTVASVGLTAGDPRFGGLKEVTAAVDLSTVTDVRVMVVGT